MADSVEVKVYQFYDFAGQAVAPLIPEHAVVDSDGVRLDTKLGAFSTSTLTALQEEYLAELEAAKDEYLEALSAYGSFSIIVGGNYLFAIVDADNNILAAVNMEGSWYIPKGIPDEVASALESLEEKLGTEISERKALIDTPVTGGEFLTAAIDGDNNVLFGSRKDGTFYIPGGIKTESGSDLDNLFTDIADRKSLIYIAKYFCKFLTAFVDGDSNVLGGFTKAGEFFVNSITGAFGIKTIINNGMIAALVDADNNMPVAVTNSGKLYVKSLTGVIKADIKKSYDYIFVLQDADGNVVAAVKKDGSWYIPKGIPDEVATALSSLQTALQTAITDEASAREAADAELQTAIDNEVETRTSLITTKVSNSRYLEATIDAARNLLYGVLRNAGEFEVKDVLTSQSGYCIKTISNLQDLFTLVDADNNVLALFGKSGDCFISNSLRSGSGYKIEGKYLSTQDLLSVIDSYRNEVLGVDKSGAVRFNALKGVFKAYRTDSYFANKNYILAVLDFKGNVLSTLRRDGTWYFPKLEVESATIAKATIANYDKKFEDLYSTIDSIKNDIETLKESLAN